MEPHQQKLWMINLLVLIVLGTAVSLIRQGGCRLPGAGQAAKKSGDKENKKKIPKPDFFSRAPTLLPGHFAQALTGRRPLGGKPSEDAASTFAQLSDPAFRNNRVKQGHWYSAYLPIVPNQYDIEGELQTFSLLPTGKRAPIPGTDHHVACVRPVSLSKGQWKNLESSVFVPVRDTKNVGSINVNYLLSRPNVSLNPFETMQPVLPMQPWQHHFVVLSDRPDAWSYLKLTDSFQLTGQTGDGGRIPPFYIMVASQPDDPIPLSRNPLQWTTTAYVLWDDVEPDRLDSGQQDAMLDWLHHGGQLIVSGPDCLDRLQASFLAPWLPAAFDGTINLTTDHVQELNKNWSIANPKRPSEKRRLNISESVPLLGVRLEANEYGKFVDGTGKMVAERQVGRGRVAVTAFSLNSPVIKTWASFQGFLNGALLRKPPRTFQQDSNYNESFFWIDRSAGTFDPLLGSTLRFISRDLGSSGTPRRPARLETLAESLAEESGSMVGVSPAAESSGNQQPTSENSPETNPQFDVWRYGGYTSSPLGGTGSWNDHSGIARNARTALQQAAGITPPSADFVFKMLAAYLLVLVPLNWIVFRLAGRVELAWLAAPMIAVVGAVMVARLASLDIGFVRSNTELGLLEIHADHPRAHLTQYSALYTSLSTRYQASLDNATSLALPFAAGGNRSRKTGRSELANVTLRRTLTNRLENYFVQSNSTGLLHLESMLDLDGTLSLTPGSADDPSIPPILSNATSLNLLAAGVVRRSAGGDQYEVAWIGDLPSGQETNLEFQQTPISELYAAWQRDPRTSNVDLAVEAVWNKNVPEGNVPITRQQLLAFPELQNRRTDYLRAIDNIASQLEIDDGNRWTLADFKNIYLNVNPVERASTGRMFQNIADHLSLASGEVRLLAINEDTLGRTKLTPKSTQNVRQTLIVAHLKPGSLPPARRDTNVRPVKRGQSNLDYEEEMLQLEEQFDTDSGSIND